MTELEQKLMDGLQALNEQYKNEMSTLNKQVQVLSKQNKELIKQYNQVVELLKEELER